MRLAQMIELGVMQRIWGGTNKGLRRLVQRLLVAYAKHQRSSFDPVLLQATSLGFQTSMETSLSFVSFPVRRKLLQLSTSKNHLLVCIVRA